MKLFKFLDKFIVILLTIVILYGIYEILSAIANDSELFLVMKTYIIIFIVTFSYLFFRKKMWGTEIFVSLIFFIKYMVFMPKGFNAFNIFIWQFGLMNRNGFDFYQLLNITISLTWMLLMILPIVNFFYLKKNRIAPYN